MFKGTEAMVSGSTEGLENEWQCPGGMGKLSRKGQVPGRRWKERLCMCRWEMAPVFQGGRNADGGR